MSDFYQKSNVSFSEENDICTEGTVFIADLLRKSPLCETVFFQSIALNARNDISFNKISVVLLRHFVLF